MILFDRNSIEGPLCRLVARELYRPLARRRTSNFDTLSTRFEFSSRHYLLFAIHGAYLARHEYERIWYIGHRWIYNFATSDRKIAVLIFAKTVGRDVRGETRDPLVKNSIMAYSRLPGMSRQFVCRTGERKYLLFSCTSIGAAGGTIYFTFLRLPKNYVRNKNSTGHIVYTESYLNKIFILRCEK